VAGLLEPAAGVLFMKLFSDLSYQPIQEGDLILSFTNTTPPSPGTGVFPYDTMQPQACSGLIHAQ
jgi:hypothetical protein